MNRNFKNFARGFLAMAAVLMSLVPPISCGLTAPSPAAPPSPPAEIPAALTFPGSVNIGFGTPSEESALNLVRPLMPIGGEFFDAIQFGFDVNDRANAAVQGTLDSLSALEIPLNPITRTFKLGDGLKIDFAEFAFPGKPEACTGCTCPTGCDAVCPTEAPEEDLRPVCYRIWRDDPFDDTNVLKPFMAGFMTQLPTRDDTETTSVDETNAGNGSFRMRLEDDFVAEISGADYHHRDTARPLDKRSDLFGVNINKPTDTSSGNAVVNLMSTAQKALEGATSEDQVLKTLRHTASEEKTLGVTDPDGLRYLAQFREDADFWSGTLQNDFDPAPGTIFVTPPDSENFENECAQLSTGIDVDPEANAEEGACNDLGIDVTNVPFLEVKASTDPSINLPADFPAVPTF